MRTRRLFTRTLLASCAAAGLASAAAPAWAQTTAPLRIVVPYPPGGSSDRAARLLAETLQPRLGQTVIVENIVGAGGRLAMRQLAALPADAPVLVLVNPALMVVAPMVYKNNGYDPDKDFQPVAQVSRYEFAAAVGPAVPVRALSHLMAWLKANPNQASIPVAVDTLDTLLPLHEGGKLRILATSGSTRAVKDLPTFQEAGFALSASGWNVLYARAGMPAAQVQKLSAEVAAVMKQPDIRDKFIALKAEPVSATREQTTAMLRDFKAQWVPVIQKAGLQFE